MHQKHIQTLIDFEDSGKGFFVRAGNHAIVWVRAKRVNDPDQWPNAYSLCKQLGNKASQPVPDALSGYLKIMIEDFYKYEASRV
jgi:hypothetical protein